MLVLSMQRGFRGYDSGYEARYAVRKCSAAHATLRRRQPLHEEIMFPSLHRTVTESEAMQTLAKEQTRVRVLTETVHSSLDISLTYMDPRPANAPRPVLVAPPCS